MTPCQLTTSFTPNTWHQISISLANAFDLKYAYNLVVACTQSSGLPDPTLNPLKPILRPAFQSDPSRVTVANFKLIRESIDALLSSNELKPTRSFVSQTTYLKTLLSIPFISEHIPPL